MDPLVPQVPQSLPVKPQWEVGLPMLAGWVGVIAYVIGFTGVVTNLTSPPPPSLLVQHRTLEMRMSVDIAQNRCATPYDYACGNYGAVNALQPFDDLLMRSKRKTMKSGPVQACKENLVFDYCGDIVWDDYSMSETLMAGLTVSGWAARAGIHDKRVALHVWDTSASRANLTMHVNPECAVDAFCSNDYSGGTCTFDVIVYESSTSTFCEVAEEYTVQNYTERNVTAPVDCPSTCVQAVRQYAPTSLTPVFALDSVAQARIEALAEQLRVLADVNTTIAIGSGPDLVPDMALEGNLSEVWAAHLAAEFELLGTAIDRPVWPAAADTVNAFYDPCQNTVFIPDGILAPPFFDASYDDELVDGGIGFVIAHELGHAIDHLCHNSSFGVAVVSHMSTVSEVPFRTVNHTMAEDVADFHGARLVTELRAARGVELTERVGLQFAQLWCLGDGPFTADEHAPGSVRANAILQRGGPFEAIFC